MPSLTLFMITAATKTNGSKVVRSFAPPVTLAFAVAALVLLAMVEINDAPITMLISRATKTPPLSALLKRNVGVLKPFSCSHAPTMLKGIICIVLQVMNGYTLLTGCCPKHLIPRNTKYEWLSKMERDENGNILTSMKIKRSTVMRLAEFEPKSYTHDDFINGLLDFFIRTTRMESYSGNIEKLLPKNNNKVELSGKSA